MELVTVVQKRVFSSVAPTKIIELFKLGEGEPPRLGIRLAEVVEGFYSFLGFTRLTSQNVVRKAVARGVKEGIIGYCSGTAPELGEDGRFKVAVDRVRLGAEVAEDEIDLDTGFIMLPSAVPQPAPVTTPGVPAEQGAGAIEPPTTPPGVPPTTEGGEPPVTPPPVETEKTVEISFSADRDALFTAWNAAANLYAPCRIAGGLRQE